jgi:hypothetical protein
MGKQECKISLGKPKLRWAGNITMTLVEIA